MWPSWGSPSLIVRTVSVDVRQYLKKKKNKNKENKNKENKNKENKNKHTLSA